MQDSEGNLLYEGCFSTLKRGEYGGYGQLSNKLPSDGFIFDASICSKIYGSSQTVMPPSINLPACIYLGANA